MGLAQNTNLVERKTNTGEQNLITDVPGVLVGHSTIHDQTIHTGVTVILPGQGLPETRKYPAACHVMNGYSKPIGLIQVEELGTLESPICLSNTLAIGTVADALTRRMVRGSSDELYSFNPLVMECNDGRLSDMKSFPVHAHHVDQAFDALRSSFEEGAVGAGCGMICYGLKGGIGSSSRVLPDGHLLGCLVLTNFGKPDELRIRGQAVSWGDSSPDKGSVIVVLATDAPLDARQLKRLCRRAQSGLARTGSSMSHGSGEIALAFSTAQDETLLNEESLDDCFRAVVECVEEAVISSMWHAEALTGYRGFRVGSLRTLLDE